MIAMNLEKVASKLVLQRKRLSTLLEAIPDRPHGRCRYFLFLTKLDGMVEPYLVLFRILKEGEEEQLLELKTRLQECKEFSDAIRGLALSKKTKISLSRKFDFLAILWRDFIFMFADPKDHRRLYNDWRLRTTPPNFISASKRMIQDIILSVCSYICWKRQATGQWPSDKEIRLFLKQLLCQRIFLSYSVDPGCWVDIENTIIKINATLKEYVLLYKEFENFIRQKKQKDLEHSDQPVRSLQKFFQVFGKASYSENNQNPNHDFGVELEFQAPNKKKNIKALAAEIQTSTMFSKLSTSSSEAAFRCPAAGILTTDESLPIVKGYFPAEFASPIFSSKKDITSLKGLVRFLDRNRCVVDESCGLHVHVSRRNLSYKAVANIVLRFARCEREMRHSFYSPSREADLNIYAPALLTAYGKVSSRNNLLKNYILMTHFIRSARNDDELCDAANICTRYTSLNTKTKYGTLEFRGHPSTLSEKRLSNYIEFVLNLIGDAQMNKPFNIDAKRYRQASVLRNLDATKRIPDPLGVAIHFNRYDLRRIPSKRTMRKLIDMNVRVAKAVHKTQKVPDPHHNYRGQLYWRRDNS